MLFNAADIFIELERLYAYWKVSDYSNVGVYLGKIGSDLFLKSPFRNSWSFRNSEIIPYELTNVAVADLAKPNVRGK